MRDLIDNNGVIRRHSSYDSFGQVQSEQFFSSTGSVIAANHPAAIDTLFGYTGRASDDATGLQNNLHRWYDAGVGRWASEDPIGFGGGDANLYRYVGNGSTSATDPSGLLRKEGQPVLTNPPQVSTGVQTSAVGMGMVAAVVGQQFVHPMDAIERSRQRLEDSVYSRIDSAIRTGAISDGQAAVLKSEWCDWIQKNPDRIEIRIMTLAAVNNGQINDEQGKKSLRMLKLRHFIGSVPQWGKPLLLSLHLRMKCQQTAMHSVTQQDLAPLAGMRISN